MRAGRRCAKRNGLSRPRLMLEQLESRVLLSGTVLVQVIGGELRITGDNADNRIRITRDGGAYYVTRTDGDTVITDGTSSGSSVGVGGVTSDTVIKMKGGNDYVLIDYVELPGGLVFDGGSGNNTLDAAILVGPVSIKNSTGDDTVWFLDSGIYGDLVVQNGSGNSEVKIEDTDVHGSVNIKNGTGDDYLFVGGDPSWIEGSLIVSNGNGDSEVEIQGYEDEEYEYTGIGGDVVLKSGTGTDDIEFETAGVAGNVDINTGKGDAYVDFDVVGELGVRALDIDYDDENYNGSSVVGGNLTIVNSNGLLDVDMDGNGESDWGFTVGGDVAVTNKKGESDIEVQYASFAGNVTLNGGDGYDEVFMDDFWVSGQLTINNGKGSVGLLEAVQGSLGEPLGAFLIGGPGSSVHLFDGEVDGKLTVSSTSGSDHVDIYDMDIYDAVDIRTGRDGDEVWLDETFITGALSVQVQDGDDFAHIGIYEDTLTVLGSTLLDGGAGFDTLYTGHLEFIGPSTVVNFEGEPV